MQHHRDLRQELVRVGGAARVSPPGTRERPPQTVRRQQTHDGGEQDEGPVAEVLHPVGVVQDVLVAQVVKHEEDAEREPEQAGEAQVEPVVFA